MAQQSSQTTSIEALQQEIVLLQRQHFEIENRLFIARLRLFYSQNGPMPTPAAPVKIEVSDGRLGAQDQIASHNSDTPSNAPRVSDHDDASRNSTKGGFQGLPTQQNFTSHGNPISSALAPGFSAPNQQRGVVREQSQQRLSYSDNSTRDLEDAQSNSYSAQVTNAGQLSQNLATKGSPSTFSSSIRPASRLGSFRDGQKNAQDHLLTTSEFDFRSQQAPSNTGNPPVSSTTAGTGHTVFDFLQHGSVGNSSQGQHPATPGNPISAARFGNEQRIRSQSRASQRGSTLLTQETFPQQMNHQSAGGFLPKDGNPRFQLEKSKVGSDTNTSPTSLRPATGCQDAHNFNQLYSQISSQIPEEIQGTAARNTWVQSQFMERLQQVSASQSNSSPASEPRPVPSLLKGTSLSGKGLTKKSKPQSHATANEIVQSSNTPLFVAPSTTQTSHNKRSLSVEITDDRPRQRRRHESDRVMTPPLNAERQEAVAKDEPNSPDLRNQSLHQHQTSNSVNRSNAAGRDPHGLPIHSTGNDSRYLQPSASLRNDQPGSISSKSPSGHNTTANAPPGRGSSRNQLRGQLSKSSSPEDHENRSRRSRNTGTPALIAEAQANAAAILPSTGRPRRKAARREQGSYKTPAYKPLSPSERRTLELRYAANVAKIIITKICVSDPPLPTDTVPISIRLKQRFGRMSSSSEGNHRESAQHDEEEEEEDRYRNAADFHADALRMLENYSQLHHCENCPFLKTGNARVMCYRMRLASIVDDRMRRLPECLKACEYDCDANDQEAKFDVVDGWFNEEDFEAARHYQGS